MFSLSHAGLRIFRRSFLMLRRIILAVFLCAFGLCLGCGGGSEKVSNPDNLEYNKEGAPKRDGVQGVKKK
jgi:uncharacterized membrane protein AbrB (regulator of aidB expression)